MKIVLDMQGAQCESRHRGIGRYTIGLARAFTRLAAPSHDVRLAFNTKLEDGTDALIAQLGPGADRDRRVAIPGLRDVRAQSDANNRRRQAASRIARYALDSQDADIVWHSSLIEGYVDDCVFPDVALADTATVGTLYDLIPLHDPVSHLGHPRVRAWYDERLSALKRCDRLLAISDWVRSDAIERLGLSAERVVTIGTGVDTSFVPPSAIEREPHAKLLASYGIDGPFVLYNGGFDPRKNVSALIRAFAELSPELRNVYRLVIVGRTSPEQLAALQAVIRAARIPPSAVVFTGFVSDQALIALYGACALFVFPSLQEGFGLPPLEAMACGAPVIGSNTTSLPEVIGDSSALFDPERTDDIAARMREVLTQPHRNQYLRSHALAQAKVFSWDAVAGRALDALQALKHSHRPAHSVVPVSVTLSTTWFIAAATAPDWLASSKHRLLSIHDKGWQEQIGHGDRIVYIVDLDSVAQVRQAASLWPGTWLFVASQSGNSNWAGQITPEEHYVLHGYCVLQENITPALASIQDYLRLCHDGMVGLLATMDALTQLQVIGLDPGFCVAIPRDDAAAFCAAQMDTWHRSGALGRELALIDDLSTSDAMTLGDTDIARIADGVAAVRYRLHNTQWLIDVSEIARRDIGTGIQRVVRSVLRAWLRHPPSGIRVEPVAFVDGHYRYVRQYTLELLGLPRDLLQDDFVSVQNGDTYVALDWTAATLHASEPEIRQWRRLGVSTHFVVNDLLPLTMPEAFHPHSRDLFKDWIDRISALADYLHCISDSTAVELANWISSEKPSFAFGHPPHIDHFPLGVDLGMAAKTPGVLDEALTAALTERPTLLMVGTLEPRKAHAFALEAVELLWDSRTEVNLVIVGHRGWLVDPLIARLSNHPERARRLFWLDAADDGMLEAIYARATALLAPSWGEGFGLPLIEAAKRALPVIARDIPVFREVMGAYPSYFVAPTPQDLASHLHGWLIARPMPGEAPDWPDWASSARALALLVGQGDARKHH
jgi:glycosyltransferase involved in cell wall biosynthesis